MLATAVDKYLSLSVLVGSIISINGGVAELWRTGLTNSPMAAYTLSDAAVDADGNTIVAGGWLFDSGLWWIDLFRTGMAAKFDSAGAKVWEYRTPIPTVAGVDSVAVNAVGDILFTMRFNPFGPEAVVALIKLSPDGAEVWGVFETNSVPVPDELFSPPAVKTDSNGNIVMTSFVTRQLAPRMLATEQVVWKFDGDGRMLWRTVLPGYGYWRFDKDYLNSLAITPKDEIVVVGGYYGSHYPEGSFDVRAFAAKLDKHGRLEWWTDQRQGPMYSSALANSKGTVAVGGRAFGGPVAIFSRRGQLLTQYASPISGEIAGITADDGFLMRSFNYLSALDSSGTRVLWQFPHFSMRLWDVVPDGEGGWIAVGTAPVFNAIMEFVGISQDGRESWRTQLPSINDIFFPTPPFVLRSPDGTLRVAKATLERATPSSILGILVMAFAVESN